MGRASNRKKARHHAARNTRPPTPSVGAEGRRQLRLLTTWQALNDALDAHSERYAAACRVWCGGQEPIPARAPWWMQAAPGRDLAAIPWIAEAWVAPCLRTAEVPDAVVLAADPAHWHVAINVLVRAVVFDGLETGHPAVSELVAALAPVADAELSSREAVWAWLDGEHRQRQSPPAFPVLDGPLVNLGQLVLAGATRSVIGDNPGSEELAVLSRAMDGMIPGMAGSVVAETLPLADPLEALIATEVVSPGKALETGLAFLSALVQICETQAVTLPRRAA